MNPRKEGTVILFQGDSITDGQRNKDPQQDWDLNHQIGHSYVYLLHAELGSRYPEKKLSFINKGVSGNRIVDAYARLESDVINRQPDIVSFMLGINDCHFQLHDGSGATPAKFDKLYRMMIDELTEQLPAVRIALLEPFLLPVGRVAESLNEWTELLVPMQAAVKRIAGEYGLLFVPLQQRFDELSQVREPSYWIWDGIHPTVNGHGIIAQEWRQAAAQWIEEL
ncbi:SGNH/GDSL hydrolase family protein [Paenibacillus mucilaginosus]|uniref:G-D-S-L family lipolytic protein n=1 Tax=Paenibacillus mucilaginosus (strain KNP414) TaxID=1036673 RepID=F8FDX4_PAEMK|nr:SGNH/GDSL hydrolase family protein [Paenibacillus mucilaginosus]AEI43174.1 G-D-S-L family lipolytic protein [Paenibacillus mucilaginosus KNP414]MCG7212262.1 SGNH/GDSL hydrolase family protein [Paenibacillus mucilaginosus]WDM24775.1 SGNH/GDSL hydrolase family protein [Paenibacillus mucilaginosus]